MGTKPPAMVIRDFLVCIPGVNSPDEALAKKDGDPWIINYLILVCTISPNRDPREMALNFAATLHPYRLLEDATSDCCIQP